MLGLRWLCHLSLHCLPSLPSTNLAIKDHLWGPYFQTSFLTRLSSWSVQGFFLRNFDLLLSDSGKESQLSSSGISSQYVFLTIQTICNLKITANIYIITQYYFSQTILPLTPIHSFAATQPLSPSLPYNIIYSKMLKFSSDNKNAVNTHSSPHHHDSIEKVLFRLKDLQQIQDESRNELCPVFLDEQSNPNLRRESTYSNRGGAHQINILKDLQLFQEEQKLQAKEAKASHKRLPYNEKKDDNVLLSNMKLKEDNIKLFSQCIRLRKICELYKTNLEEFHKQPKVEQKNQREAALERQLSQLMIKHQDLNRTNKILEDKVLKLEDKIKKLTSQISSTSLKAGRFEKISSQVHLLQRQNDTLAKKVIYLEKELQLSSSRCDSKSISIHNTTQQSRKGDLQKDRMITNMKIVHESEVRKLKGMIEQLQRELGREVGGGSSRR